MARTSIDERWFDFIRRVKDDPGPARVIQIILASERMSAAFLNFTGKSLSEVIGS
jgi:hypothetical protein